ncbi:3-isopropylmalate dehydratase large subunit [Tenuibacillus multivorans]|uniref:aconitate hydratase n=1 Tax=Tenuibacillus multivorans TaxID=237069 RepID=A0A1H0BNM6_9BACI|nr:aconitase/3-isopropylmalate dehydratase large subunit family protein [Tenuibacillus multivorans]GEL77098.1 3-isopropylmalate dehydratase large subunit [Tenuibacillus multivorans]SDN47172.1 3-isopropylmalate/(R)-2-methylmalate dehydratase large subunit [Tenuibacillus multivorans]
MTGKTMVEKILSNKSKSMADVRQGDLTIVDVDLMVCHDANRPQASDIFKEMGGDKVYDPDKVKLVMDHAPGVPNQSASGIHAKMREFSSEQGAELIGPGEGICHQILAEKGEVGPGDLVLGTDSHTCTNGAFNAIGVGVGTSDLAAALLTGKTWVKVPESFQVELEGSFPENVYPKDVALEIIRILKADGATYKALEFTGEAIKSISVAGRMTISNMAVEAGAKTAIFPFDNVLKDWLEHSGYKKEMTEISPDEDAKYERKIVIDVSKLRPRISLPDQVENITDGHSTEGLPIQQAVIGTCTNGRLEDLREAARILENKKVAQGVKLFITPASRETYAQALEEGIIEIFIKAGAILGVPGCSGCSGGAHFAIPSDGDNVITAANRNFVGRLGNKKAHIYLASPAVVAQSAVSGHIKIPEEGGKTAS